MLFWSSGLNPTLIFPISECPARAVAWHLPLLSPVCISTCWPPLPLKLGWLCVYPSGRPVPAGSGLGHAFWAQRHLRFAFFKFLPTSFFSLPPHWRQTLKGRGYPKYLFVLEFWISNIYLNEMSNNLGITTMDLFCFYNICHKKSVFYCKWL